MDIKLKIDDDPLGFNRTWVNKDKFKQFKSEYSNSQDKSALTNTLNVQFEINVISRENYGKFSNL